MVAQPVRGLAVEGDGHSVVWLVARLAVSSVSTSSGVGGGIAGADGSGGGI